jgi:aldehyde dehydrogenase (NAD+)
VFDDADLDSAVEGVVDAIWFNQGQVCCAGSRLIVQEAVAERFHEKLRQRMKNLRVGDPLDKSTDIGAIVADVQLERIRGLVEQGRAEGASAGSRNARCRRAATTSCRRCSRPSRRHRSWPARRFSGRCWFP